MNVLIDSRIQGHSRLDGFTRVQNILFGQTDAERELCFHAHPLVGSTGIASSDGHTLRCTDGVRVHFDRLLNTFFENYWQSIAEFSTIRLTLSYRGSALVILWRENIDDAGNTKRTTLTSIPISPDQGSVSLDIAASNFTGLGRPGLINFSIESDTGFELMEGHWEIDAPVKRDINLALTTCTLNYKKMMPAFFAGIERNLQDEWLRSSVTSVIIINNGPETYDPVLSEAYPEVHKRLRVVHLKNVGASGGFTRGIFEAEADESVSNIALLDDDAILASGSLLKALTILSVSEKSLIIGGQMLDLARPHKLLASGQFFDAATTELANPVLNLDLTQPDWKVPFLERHVGQWNGWWLTIFPRNVFTEIGYPLPLFVKWDDVEFGVRAEQLGHPTMTFPAVSVWHDAPDMKPLTWHVYYNTRNGYIIKTLREAEGGPPALKWRKVTLEFLYKLLTFEYYQAKLVIESVSDYAAGPSVLNPPVRTQFKRLLEIGRNYPSFTTSAKGRMSRWSRYDRLKPSKWLLLKSWFWNLTAPVPASVAYRSIGSRFVSWDHFYRVDAVYVDDPALDTALVFRRNREMARALSKEFVTVLFEALRNQPAIRRAWVDAEPGLTSRGRWDRFFEENEQHD